MDNHQGVEMSAASLDRFVKALAGAAGVSLARRKLRQCRARDLWGLTIFDLGDPERLSHEQIAKAVSTALGRCHANAARANLQCVSKLFAPFWDDIPLEMARVSYKCAVWQLVLGSLSELPRPSDTASCPFDENDPVGDFLFVHLAISDKIQQLSSEQSRYAELELQGPCGGGLRSREVLDAYSALLFLSRFPERMSRLNRVRGGFGDSRPRGRFYGFPWIRGKSQTRGLLESVHRLIEANPLSQLVYLDIVAHGRAVGSETAIQAKKDHQTEITTKALKPVLRPTEKQHWWCNLWTTHLARCLLGSVVSPVYDRDKATQEHLSRLEILASIFVIPEANLLHARFLDLLVRYVASEINVELVATWKSHRGTDAARRDRTLLSRESPLCRRFMHLLTGGSIGELAKVAAQGTNDQSANDKVRDACSHLITVCEPELVEAAEKASASQLAKGSSFLEQHIAELISRLTDDVNHGIELAGIGRTLAPASLLRVWMLDQLALFSTVSAGTSEAQQPEVGAT